jgi:two-component system, OmpR family, sensor histidine kinase ArlS
MFSIKTKIIFGYTLVFGVLLTVFAIVVYQSSKNAAFNKLDANLKSYSVSLQSEITEELGEGHFDHKELAAIRPEGLSHACYQLINTQGQPLLYDPHISKSFSFDPKQIPKDSTFFREIKIHKRRYRVLVTPFETIQDSLYILETAASIHEAYADLDRLFYLFLFMIPIGLIVTGFTAYIISKAAFRPITRIVNTAKEISVKNLNKRLEVPRVNDEVKELAETLNEMIERLDNSFKSQRIFIANASHEIKTPLTAIQTQLEVLERNMNGIEDKKTIEDSISEIEKLTKLTNSLLILEKLDSSMYILNLEEVRIDELLTECVQMINKLALTHCLKIKLSLFDAVEMTADKEKLRSVFANLLDNAVKYSFSNTEIHLELHEPTDNKVTVTLKNYGPGISEEEIGHVFNRFYRSNNVRAEVDGSGLGLSIAKEIIELHKGQISTKSEPGKATTFTIIIPINISQ